jgi:predicted outer membrane repeat protein
MNVTFSDNTATNNGGAIYNKAGVILVNATIADNAAEGQGGAIFNDGASSWSKNTIWFGNVGADGSCSGDAGVQNSQGYNLGDDTTCNLTATGDITTSNPLLGPMQDNGGPTWTHALLLGSPAIDHGTNTGCPATDQRGMPRPHNGVCDIGAFEFGNLLPTYILTTQTAGNGSGTMTRAPNQPTYFAGTVVTLTAVPSVGSKFAGWSGAVGGMTSSVTITMDANKSVTATFDLMTYTLAINTVGNGMVIRQPDQPSYLYGTQVALTATANPGYSFAGWSGSATGFANPLRVTMTVNKIITATFVLGQLPIADAGQPQTVKSRSLVTLDGSSSSDPNDHVPLIYGWQQIGGETVLLSSAIISRPTFTAPAAVTQPQTLTFALVVTNALGTASTPGEVIITVESYRCLLPLVLKE